MKQADRRDIFKKSSGVRTSTVVVSPDPLSPTPSASSAIQTLEKTEEDPHDPERADQEDIQMRYFCG